MASTKTYILKKKMLEALIKSLGVVYSASQSLNKTLLAEAKTEDDKKSIPQADSIRARHYEWLQKDEKYKDKVEAIKDIALNFAESQLHKRMQNGSDTAIIFYLKTQGKGRGYIERTKVAHSGEATVNVIVEGEAADYLKELEKEK